MSSESAESSIPSSMPSSVPSSSLGSTPEKSPPVVRLRVPTEEDAYAWHRVFDDPEVMEFHGGRSAEVSVYEELTARQRKHDAERGFCLWTMLDEDDEVVGFTGAQPWPLDDWGPAGEVEIGWRLGRAHWGRGYATTAARATIDRVRAKGLDHVVAMVHPQNTRSLAVTERLGMTLSRTYESQRSGVQIPCFRLELGED